MGADGVVLDLVGFRSDEETEDVIEFVEVEAFVFQGADSAFLWAILPLRSLGHGAEVSQLGVGADEQLEVQRHEWSTVVRDDRGDGRELADGGGAPMWCVKRWWVAVLLGAGRRGCCFGSWHAGSGCGGGPGRGRLGPGVRLGLVCW